MFVHRILKEFALGLSSDCPQWRIPQTFGGGVVLLALPAFLPFVIFFFYPKEGRGWLPEPPDPLPLISATDPGGLPLCCLHIEEALFLSAAFVSSVLSSSDGTNLTCTVTPIRNVNRMFERNCR